MNKRSALSLAALLISIFLGSAALAALTPEQELGQLLYFDRYLSLNHNQSCASCHDPNHGFADPLDVRLPELYPVSAGSDTTLFGGRNAPPAGYAAFSPLFGLDTASGLYVGGQFWDGRAVDLKAQAKGPFLNPVEMAMANEAAVIAALRDPFNKNAAAYQAAFAAVYGIDLGALDLADNAAVLDAYDKLAGAIAAFETSDGFFPFSSKFDYVMAGLATFEPLEQAGWDLFNGAAMCAACHPAPLFTDFTYDNLGIPHSKSNLLKKNPADLGLGAIVNDPAQNGKFKVSSLRNIAVTAPYGHNGYFATLEEIVHFYNTRDVATWPKPEVRQNVNVTELGNLGLTAADEAALAALLKTLTDGYGPPLGIPAGAALP